MPVPEERHRVPDWFVERLVANDLSPSAAARIRARLEASGELHRVGELEASNAAILAEHSAADVAVEVQRRLHQRNDGAHERTSTIPRLATRAFAIASAVALVGALAMRWPAVETPGTTVPLLAAEGSSPKEMATIKGLSPHVIIYRKTTANPERLSGSTQVRAGDTLQVAYVAAGRRFGVVASVDATGSVSLHLPERPGGASPLVGQAETPLPHAFELDDSPGFERFIFVTGDRPFSTTDVVESLRPGGAPLPADLTASDVILQKTAQ
jgi:hypothetical protein